MKALLDLFKQVTQEEEFDAIRTRWREVADASWEGQI